MITISSMAEITRVGGWSLRGLGYPFGTAERATKLLAWAQAVDGTAIKSLRLLEAKINVSRQAKVVKLQSSNFDRHIEAEGKHLLEIGPPALDLVTSDARRHGFGHVDVCNVHGLNFVPALVNLLTRRKLDALVIYRAGSLDVMPEAEPEAGWITTSGSGNQGTFRRGDLKDRPEQFVREIFGIGAPAEGGEIASRIAGNVAFAENRSTAGYMSVTAIHPSPKQSVGITSLIQSLGKADNSSQRVEAALRDGFSIDLQDLQYLYELEMRTWAPTSERSRGQAGYGVY